MEHWDESFQIDIPEVKYSICLHVGQYFYRYQRTVPLGTVPIGTLLDYALLAALNIARTLAVATSRLMPTP